MKLKTGVVGILAALLAITGFATLAGAAVAPTVTLTVRNAGGTQISSALIGSGVFARVEVASTSASTSPTGTVDFSWYSGQSCSGTATPQTGVALSSGIATSGVVTVPAGGLSFKAHYNGQTDLYTEADSACVPLSATEHDTALSLSLSDNSIVVGSSVYAIPSLTGETSGADGTISYKVYTNNSCTNLDRTIGSKSVTNGSTQNSDASTFNTQGTYYWQAVYSGDEDNEAATSSCTGAVLTVSTNDDDDGEGDISGTSFNDKNKNGTQDSGEEGLSGWTIWLREVDQDKGGWWWRWNKKHIDRYYNSPVVETTTTDSNGNYSFDNLDEGIYFVEQQIEDGWKQTSPDKRVVIDGSDDNADVDFSNVEKKNNRNHDDEDEDEDNDEDEDDNDDEDNDHHDHHDRGHDKDNGNHND